MAGAEREREALEKLLKIARRKAEEIAAQVADLEAARASALASLDWIAQSEREEAVAARTDDGAFALDYLRYAGGADERRRSLSATVETLTAEIEANREMLSGAHVETRKLEHLIAVSDRFARRRRDRSEAINLEELARFRMIG